MKKTILTFLVLGNLILNAQEKSWTLEECIRYALNNDLVLKETALNEDFYQNEITGAYGNLLPNANLYADHQYNFGSVIDPTTNARISSDIRANSFSFSSNVELFNWGNFVKIKSAKLQKEKAIYELEIKKNELIIRIVQAFNQVQYDKEQIELIRQQLENTQLMLNRIETEFNLGNKAKSDLYEIQANKVSEEQMLVTAQNAYKVSKITLLNLLNLKEEVDFLQDENLIADSLHDTLPDLYETGLQSRPEIKAAEIQKEISRKKIEQEKSSYLPRINANYSLSSFYVDTETASLRDQFKNNKNHYLGFSINIPVFNKLQTRTAVQQGKIEWEQANLQSEQQKQAYYNALRDAYTKTQNAFETWQASEKNVEAQKISFARTEEKFRQGMIDAYGYFAAKNNLLSAQTSLLQAKYTFHYQNVLLNFYVTNEVL